MVWLSCNEIFLHQRPNDVVIRKQCHRAAHNNEHVKPISQSAIGCPKITNVEEFKRKKNQPDGCPK